MACHTVEQTNAKIEEALVILRELDAWADEDYQHAMANDGSGIARDDMRRANRIHQAINQLEACKR